jgi:hypothetical protein
MTNETYIDLVHYIKVRTRCTTGTAHRVLRAGIIRVDGMIVGVDSQGRLDPWIPAEMRSKIEFV